MDKEQTDFSKMREMRYNCPIVRNCLLAEYSMESTLYELYKANKDLMDRLINLQIRMPHGVKLHNGTVLRYDPSDSLIPIVDLSGK